IAVALVGTATCPDLNVDPRAAKQVLVNLLANAIKFTPSAGRVEMQFAGRAEGGVTITISDTGIGMSADDIRLAFEPFGRAAHRASQAEEGTGLGLPLARALVRLHGGDVSLTSAPGSGTTVVVTFPSAPDDTAEPRLLPAPDPTQKAA